MRQYAFDPGTPAEKAEVENHLAACAECRDELQFLQNFEDALQRSEVWDLSDHISVEVASSAPDDLRRQATTIDEERCAARAALEPLLGSVARFEKANIEQIAAFLTDGGIAVLNEAAHTVQKKEPPFALLIANAAVAIARRLASTGKSRTTLHLGRAYLERGSTLFRIGKYNDAEQSFNEAEKAFENTTEWDLATVWLLRAILYVESERVIEARAFATKAARQFRLFGDYERYLHAELVLGSVLFMQGEYRASAETAERVAQLARSRGTTTLVALAVQNAGEAHLLLREYEQALACYVEAYAIWEELGMEVERIRTNWSLATIDVETGDVERGIRRLAETHRVRSDRSRE